ncbi:MAG: hypothetical protein U0599_14210 [Vicinamibacteria bacterium]
MGRAGSPENLFDRVDGSYRCPATQQGYSPFTTWTRGQAWVLLGYAGELEFETVLTPSSSRSASGTRSRSSCSRRCARSPRTTSS